MRGHATIPRRRLTRLGSGSTLLPCRSTKCSISTIPTLASWDLNSFRNSAFTLSQPRILPGSPPNLPPACTNWFIHDRDLNFDLAAGVPHFSELNLSFWHTYEDLLVPLEFTSDTTFERTQAPLKLLLAHIVSRNGVPACMAITSGDSPSLYLAQCDTRDLPAALQADVPIPELVKQAGRGDLYASSLWLGRPPTYTPLHRDPNPNLLMQLAGRKVVRMFRPEVGQAVFDEVQRRIPGGNASAKFRGEDMMVGTEKELLYQAVWSDRQPRVLQHVHEAVLDIGGALFIPKGWWHSVKSIGEGVSASVNWWFR